MFKFGYILTQVNLDSIWDDNVSGSVKACIVAAVIIVLFHKDYGSSLGIECVRHGVTRCASRVWGRSVTTSFTKRTMNPSGMLQPNRITLHVIECVNGVVVPGLYIFWLLLLDFYVRPGLYIFWFWFLRPSWHFFLLVLPQVISFCPIIVE